VNSLLLPDDLTEIKHGRIVANTRSSRPNVFQSISTHSSFKPADKELPDVSNSTPVCPLHKKAMIRIEVEADNHLECTQDECPIRWNPTTSLYYLKTKGARRLSKENVN
jgi:hypothetical protein